MSSIISITKNQKRSIHFMSGHIKHHLTQFLTAAVLANTADLNLMLPGLLWVLLILEMCEVFENRHNQIWVIESFLKSDNSHSNNPRALTVIDHEPNYAVLDPFLPQNCLYPTGTSARILCCLSGHSCTGPSWASVMPSSSFSDPTY